MAHVCKRVLDGVVHELCAVAAIYPQGLTSRLLCTGCGLTGPLGDTSSGAVQFVESLAELVLGVTGLHLGGCTTGRLGHAGGGALTQGCRLA